MYLAEFFYKNILKRDVPYYAKYSLLTIVWKPIRKFINVVIIPNIPFNNLRIMLYRLLGFSIGKNVFIGMKCYMDDMDPSKTIIKDDVIISYGCYFACHGKNQDHTHIVIENNAYIGMKSMLISGKKGINIGEFSVVGTGTLVNKDVQSSTTVVGVPMREIKKDEKCN